MREDANGGEVRIKLHITTKAPHPHPPLPLTNTQVHHPAAPYAGKLDNNSAKYGKLGCFDEMPSPSPASDHQVKNIWMCLNYSSRPTVSHVIDYVRKYYNYFSTAHDDMMMSDSSMDSTYHQQQQQQLQLLDEQIKLYLDGYWLPPYESSRLIRENDCIKVDILKPQYDESSYSQVAKKDYNVQMEQQQQPGKFGKNEFEAVKQSQKLTVKEAFVPELKSSNLNKQQPSAKNNSNSNNQAKEHQIKASYKKFAVGAYVHLLNEDVKPPTQQMSSNKNKTAPVKKEQPEQQKPSNNHKYFDDEENDESMVEVSKIKETAAATNGNESDTGSSSSSDSSDGLSEEQVIDDYYQKIKSSKKSSKRAKKMSVTAEAETTAASNFEQPQPQQIGQASDINQNDLDKIASNVNATGKNKWKNSKQKQTNTNGPKHIVFPSTESSSSESQTSASTSSGTTSSSETDSPTNNKDHQTEPGDKAVQKKKRRSRKNKNKKAQEAATGAEAEQKESENKDNTGASGSEKEGKAAEKSKSRNRSRRQRNKKRLQDQQAASKDQQQQQEADVNNQQGQEQGGAATSRYYEPSKDEQLNALSYNRTFTIQNPKSLVDFKKIFNQTKLNAPNAEEYFSREQLDNATQPSCPVAAAAEEPKQPSVTTQQHAAAMIDLHDTNDMHLSMNSSQMSTSTSADSLSSSSNANCDTTTGGNTGADETKATKSKSSSKRHRRRSPKAPRYDFEALEPLRGAPRVGDKLAFQILEISSSFTPEISSYKTGAIVEFDQSSNEVTVKLNSKHHSVLNKPSKFSVVLDEDVDQEAIAAQSEESCSSLDTTTSSIHDPKIIKMDWRNLMNVKLLPAEPEQPKVQDQ